MTERAWSLSNLGAFGGGVGKEDEKKARGESEMWSSPLRRLSLVLGIC